LFRTDFRPSKSSVKETDGNIFCALAFYILYIFVFRLKDFLPADLVDKLAYAEWRKVGYCD
jgi:hypothetical protein